MEKLINNKCVSPPPPPHQPPFPELRPGFPPNYYSKVINIQHMYKLMVKIINFKAIPCVHIVQLVKTFTEEKMQLITGNIDFVCCQCWKKEKRERFHFPDLINNNFFYLRTLHLEFVNCVMCEKDSLFVLFTNQASIYSRDVYIYVYPGYSKKLYLEYHAYKLG